MQMAVKPLIVLHDTFERFQVSVQIIDAIIAKVQFIGCRSVMSENKIDSLVIFHYVFNISASIIHFLPGRHLGVPPGNAPDPDHTITPDSVLTFVRFLA